jgi:uncharacterized HAD superfamily protein
MSGRRTLLTYRSVVDLTQALQDNLHRLPRDIDLVVGMPQSGMLLANLVALHLQRPLTDLNGFLENRLIASGPRSGPNRNLIDCRHARRPLIVGDSVSTGAQMATARRRLERIGMQFDPIFMAAYVSPQGRNTVELILEDIPHACLFEWNLLHHDIMRKTCVGIDGVLCPNPTKQEYDDGPRYESFLRSAPVLRAPTRKIGWLVTLRPERYRSQTEDWLEHAGIRYSELLMLDLPGAQSRRGLGAHEFKAEIYHELKSPLFIESDRTQAVTIADRAGKPVLSLQANEMIHPGIASDLEEPVRRAPDGVRRRLETNMGSFMRRFFRAPDRLAVGD